MQGNEWWDYIPVLHIVLVRLDLMDNGISVTFMKIECLPNFTQGVWYGGKFFYIQECKNILIFNRRFEITFFRKDCILKKENHSQNITTIYGNPTFLQDRNICHYEKFKIPLSPPKATCRQSPSITPCRHPPPQAGHRPLATTTSIKGIFNNLSNVLGNSIYIPNSLKYHARKSYFRKQHSWEYYSKE